MDGQEPRFYWATGWECALSNCQMVFWEIKSVNNRSQYSHGFWFKICMSTVKRKVKRHALDRTLFMHAFLHALYMYSLYMHFPVCIIALLCFHCFIFIIIAILLYALNYLMPYI